MKYGKAVEELESRGSDRKEPALESTEKALKQLGSPEKDYKVVLVGGTNGKGSTVEMVSEGLQSLGFNVGTFKSPHLVTCRERVKLNGGKITREEFLKLYQEINSTPTGKELTFFEFMTVMAFLHYQRTGVDYAIMEVGMGGRLDATNAADPEISVITNVGKDHTKYLGETREEIAEEKAGITPENGTLVTSEDLKPIEEKAEERSTEVVPPVEIKSQDDNYIYKGQKFSLPIAGSFQKENLENAVKAVELLEGEITDLENAFADLRCSGRMEKVGQDPLYIQDGAHNPEALRKAVEDIPENIHCVFNAVKSKNISEMINILEPKVEKFYFTKSSIDRSEKPEKIASLTDKPFEIIQNPVKAEEKALNNPNRRPVVLTGSIYLIGAVRE